MRHGGDAVRGEPDPVAGGVDAQKLAERERVRRRSSAGDGDWFVPVHHRHRLRRAFPVSSETRRRRDRLVQARGLAVLFRVVVVVVAEEIIQPLVDRGQRRVRSLASLASLAIGRGPVDPRAVRREAASRGRLFFRRGARRRFQKREVFFGNVTLRFSRRDLGVVDEHLHEHDRLPQLAPLADGAPRALRARLERLPRHRLEQTALFFQTAVELFEPLPLLRLHLRCARGDLFGERVALLSQPAQLARLVASRAAAQVVAEGPLHRRADRRQIGTALDQVQHHPVRHAETAAQVLRGTRD